jgi:hypothetical protein
LAEAPFAINAQWVIEGKFWVNWGICMKNQAEKAAGIGY